MPNIPTYPPEAKMSDAPMMLMKPSEYITKALRTESTLRVLIVDDDGNPDVSRVLHAAMGLCTESGELLDALKKNMFYGKELDIVNLQEEVGDLFWYIAMLCDALGVTFEEVWEQNIAKLRARYPEKFTEHHAENRDLQKERDVLEGNQ
jgi:NTP pyrophosphatase (non-canonical NTP hydrolase)